MHIAEVVTIAKSLPLLRLNTYKSLILSYSADYRRIFSKKLLLAKGGAEGFKSNIPSNHPITYQRYEKGNRYAGCGISNVPHT